MTNSHDDDVKSENIKRLLLRCGVSDKTQGFGFLANAVLLSLTERRRKISDIYSEIGDAIGYPETKVHHYVDYSIDHARKLCDTINQILGTKYASFQLKNKLVVSLLTMCYYRLYPSDI